MVNLEPFGYHQHFQVNPSIAGYPGKILERTALIFGNNGIVKRLIEKDAALDVQDIVGNTSLIWAAYDGNIAAVKWLIQNNARINIYDHHGKTALFWAVQHGKNDVVSFLIENKADLDVPDIDKCTALIIAISMGKNDLVGILIDSHASPEWMDMGNSYDVIAQLIDESPLKIFPVKRR